MSAERGKTVVTLETAATAKKSLVDDDSLEAKATDESDSIVAQLSRFGARIDPEIVVATRALYRPYLSTTPAGEEHQDLRYGDNPRQRLDVYLPKKCCLGVVINIHGGGFLAGDKRSDCVFNGNIGRWLAAHGYAAVLPNYRLAPEFTWPSGAHDVRAVVEWVAQQRTEFGWHALPIVLWGQSAGATHVANWLFEGASQDGQVAHVNAVMLLSGTYQVADPLTPGLRAYFGSDPAQYAARSPLAEVKPVNPHLWLAVAEFDPPAIAAQAYGLAEALTLANGRSPDLCFLRGHNHVSPICSLGTPHADAGREILRFLRTRV